MRRRLMQASLAATVLAVLAAPLPALARTTTASSSSSSATTSYIVRFKKGTNPASEISRVRTNGARVNAAYDAVFPGFAGELSDATVQSLKSNPNVASIEPDGVVKAADTQTGATWGLDRIDQRALPLNTSYTYPAAGAGVTAYIIDTGINSAHGDFSGRMQTGYDAVGDGNGTNDCNGHGTHVSGTVAGSTYGVAKQAVLVPVRVLDCSGSGTWSGVIAGLNWVVANHPAGTPAVANMSLGGGASSSIDAAVQAVIDDGVTVAVAAGNSNGDACLESPARAANALTVGATTNADARASFSNYGSCVDIFAPGVSITSDWYSSSSATAVLSGTSMASPHVAGAAAVLLSQQPSLTPAQVASNLTSAATTGVVTSPGTGSPNRLLYVTASTAPVTTTTTTTAAPTTTTTTAAPITTTTTTAAPVTTTTTAAPVTTTTTAAPTTTTTTKPKAPATPPKAPAAVKASGFGRFGYVTWTPGSDGGSPLLYQVITIYQNGKRTGAYFVPSWAKAVIIGPLPQNATFTFSIRSVNSVGSSGESALSNSITATSSFNAKR